MNKILFWIGILCFVIPIGLQIIDSKEQEHVIETYEMQMEQCDSQEMKICLDSATDYNQILYEFQETLDGNVTEDMLLNSDYQEQLNLLGTGIMGHIQIPTLDMKLPIYHGTEEEVLANGIGHMEGSSLPIGGSNTHAVLTGHRGLPSAELFTRLDELKEQDLFFLHICNQILSYEVKDIQVVEPDAVETVQIVAGKDLVSLVTCTPYGINTHRLVVTGERMEIEKNVIEEMILKEEEKVISGQWGWLCIMVLGIAIFLRGRKEAR